MTNDELDALEARLRDSVLGIGQYSARQIADAIRELRAEVQRLKDYGQRFVNERDDLQTAARLQGAADGERISALRAALDNCNHLRSALENSVAPLRAEVEALRKDAWLE